MQLQNNLRVEPKVDYSCPFQILCEYVLTKEVFSSSGYSSGPSRSGSCNPLCISESEDASSTPTKVTPGNFFNSSGAHPKHSSLSTSGFPHYLNPRCCLQISSTLPEDRVACPDELGSSGGGARTLVHFKRQVLEQLAAV